MTSVVYVEVIEMTTTKKSLEKGNILTVEEFFNQFSEYLKRKGVGVFRYGEVENPSSDKFFSLDTYHEGSVDPDFYSGRYGYAQLQNVPHHRSVNWSIVLYGNNKEPFQKLLENKAKELAKYPSPKTANEVIIGFEEMSPEKAKEICDISVNLIKNYARMKRNCIALLGKNEVSREFSRVKADYERKITGIKTEYEMKIDVIYKRLLREAEKGD